MALPIHREAQLFYRAAKQRFEDAKHLLDVERNTASVYLAGYGVECMLKALVLSTIAGTVARREVVDSFRGARGHDFGWLRNQYLEQGGPSLPAAIARDFALVNAWTTDVRYTPGSMKKREAQAFLDAAERIIAWADGRL